MGGLALILKLIASVCRNNLFTCTNLIIHPSTHIISLTPRSVLYADYEPNTFLWFAVQLIRSMLIVAIKVLAANWPPVQVSLAVLVRQGGHMHASNVCVGFVSFSCWFIKVFHLLPNLLAYVCARWWCFSWCCSSIPGPSTAVD